MMAKKPIKKTSLPKKKAPTKVKKNDEEKNKKTDVPPINHEVSITLNKNKNISEAIEVEMRTIWPFANVTNLSAEKNNQDKESTPLLEPSRTYVKQEDGTMKEVYLPGVVQTKNEILRDKSIEFSAVLSEPFFFFAKWQPIMVDNELIGMQLEKMTFNTFYRNSKRWAEFLMRLLNVEEVYVSGIINIVHLGVTKFDLACFDPKLMQQLDITIKDLMKRENEEKLQYMIDDQNNAMFGLDAGQMPTDPDDRN